MLPKQHQGQPHHSHLLFYFRNGETIIKLLQRRHWNNGEPYLRSTSSEVSNINIKASENKQGRTQASDDSKDSSLLWFLLACRS